MAYSDYGGYAYRNGRRVEERSDATITPEGDTFGTPGAWPGFGMLAAGVPHEEVQKRIEWPNGHAVLGDGPIYVVLYKQSYLSIYRGPNKLDSLAFLKDAPEAAIEVWKDKEGIEHRWLNEDHFKTTEECCVFEVDGYRVEAFFRIEDNHYQYVRLIQPDGNVWHGWSGYGVGAGLEDCGYGYSTSDREDMLKELWPESIAV